MYPRVSYGICGGTHANSFVVKPDGNLRKYWNEISLNGREIGNLKGNSTNISRFAKWINFDPTEIEKCKNCEDLF